MFGLEQIGAPGLACASSASTADRVVRSSWYRFRLRYTALDYRARLRAKVWRREELEPSVWQADCWTKLPAPVNRGALALYQDGGGVAYWDDLLIRPVTGTLTPIPSP